MHRSRTLIAAISLSTALAACGGATAVAGVSLASPASASEVIAEAPAGLTVLDVRTPAEFADGHLADAINIDFYEADFADQLAQLDKDVPYVMYCRSGNRSATAAEIMRDLGFTEVYEVDGGILAWVQSGLPITDQ